MEGVSQEDLVKDAEAIGQLMEAVLSVEKEKVKVRTIYSSRWGSG